MGPISFSSVRRRRRPLAVALLIVCAACTRESAPSSVPTAPPVCVADCTIFRDMTESSGIQFTYRNGEEADQYAILELVGGGLGAIDYDGDGLLDLFLAGGGWFGGSDKTQIKGHPCKLFKNLGQFRFQ